MSDAQFFIDRPTVTDETEQHLTIYIDAEGKRLKWSGKFPLPDIDSRVNITMNGIGEAIVKGYFQEGGYLGVMTLPVNPPEWLRKQRSNSYPDEPEWAQQGIGCEFGIEISQL